MTLASRGPVLLLAGAGILLLLLAAAATFAGLVLAERIHALLPPITSDAAAVGGAALALGASCGLAGAAHLALAILLRRPRTARDELVLVSGIVLCAVMAALAAGWAVAAFVSAASGSAPVAGMLPAGAGLGALAVAYAWAAAALMRTRNRASRPD